MLRLRAFPPSQGLRSGLLATVILLTGCRFVAGGQPPGSPVPPQQAPPHAWITQEPVAASLDPRGGSPLTSYNAVDFLSPSIGFAAGESCPGSTTKCSGIVMATRDGGSQWHALSPVPGPLQGLLFLTSQAGFAWGDQGLYRTTDGGQTWTLSYRTPVLFVSFASPDDGWIGLGGGGCAMQGCGLSVESTRDGGKTWQAIAGDANGPGPAAGNSPTGSNLPWGDYSGLGDLGHGSGYVWNGIPTGQMLRTTDGGKTWQATLPVNFSADTSISILPNGTGWALSHPPTQKSGPQVIYHTADGGATWQELGPIGGPRVQAVTAADGSLWFLIGRSSQVQGAYQEATPWKAPPEAGPGAGGQAQLFASLDPLNQEDAFAVTIRALGAGSISYTNNGGQTWSSVLSAKLPPIPGLVLGFWSPKDGYGFGGAGDPSSFFMTHDGGLTWQLSGVVPASLSIGTEGGFTDSHDGYLVDTGENPWVTRDGGKTWLPFPGPVTPLPGNFGAVRLFGLLGPKGAYAVAGPGTGKLYLTSDRGGHWVKTRFSPSSISFSGPVGWMLSTGVGSHTLYESLDGGRTWQAVMTSIPHAYSVVKAEGGYGSVGPVSAGSSTTVAVAPPAVWLWDPLDNNLAVSGNEGQVFTLTHLPSLGGDASYGTPVPSGPETGLVEGANALWQTTDGGVKWTLVAPIAAVP